LDVLFLVAGLVLLVTGAQALVTNASKLASSLGVSELAIGLTVVAFGTSAPELAVNLGAALGGNTGLAFGNVVGSNIANIGLVVGLCALVRPLLIEEAVVRREIPMMLLASAAALILGMDGGQGGVESYDRSDGLMLLLLFSVFLYYTSIEFMTTDGSPAPGAGASAVSDALRPEEAAEGTSPNRRRLLLLAAAGLVALVAGAEFTVWGAVSLAESLGVSKAVIGLTIVAVGTSLPELATSLVATWKGQTSLAIGNVVGSNIFNLLFVLGATAVVHPVELPADFGRSDLVVMALFGFALIPIARISEARVPRAAGFGLIVAYGAFVSWRLMG
jgi:cation:H+ antiporter